MSLGVDGSTVWLAASVLALAGSLVLLHRTDLPVRAYARRLRTRWLWGLPWGTLVVIGWLFAVYLFVQRGWWHWYRPVVVAFTAVAMWDPTGWLLAGFSHVSPAHLRGNVTTTLVFAPIVEWIWGHRTGREGPLSAPGIRAFVLFPLGVAGITVFATLSSWGPVIGFSVGAYALIGIVLVHRPVLALLGLLARSVVRFAWRTIDNPVQFAETSVEVVEPSWYGSAVQGHLVGLLIGILVGLWLLRGTDRAPSPGRLYSASLVLGVSLSLWTIWWIVGPEQFVLYRGAGALVVLAIATLVTVSATGVELPVPEPRRMAVGVLVVAVVGMGIVGMGLNLAPAEPAPDSPGLTVGDYRITYAEDVPDGMVNVVDIEAFGLTTDVRTSGVIVASERRNVWRRTTSKAELATHGVERFSVGGLGWSREIIAVRNGWIPLGTEPVYIVWLGVDGEFEPSYASPSRQARAVLANRTFTVRPEDGKFFVDVHHEGEVETARVPDADEVTTAMGVEFFREGEHLVAVVGDSGVPIATRETYE